MQVWVKDSISYFILDVTLLLESSASSSMQFLDSTTSFVLACFFTLVSQNSKAYVNSQHNLRLLKTGWVGFFLGGGDIELCKILVLYYPPPVGRKMAFLCDYSCTTTQTVIFKPLLTHWQEYREVQRK